jgi:hypothetical protein
MNYESSGISSTTPDSDSDSLDQPTGGISGFHPPIH